MTRTVWAVMIGAMVTGCDEAVEPPIPGTLWVSVTTPAADDHAVLLTIRGPGVTGLRATNSNHQLYWRLLSDEEARIIVIGGIRSGPLLLADVSDVNGPYTAELTQVASASDELRATLSGYGATVAQTASGL